MLDSVPSSGLYGNSPLTLALTAPSTATSPPTSHSRLTISQNTSPSVQAAADPGQTPTGQINFAPLGTNTFDYKLAITITVDGKKPITYNYNIGANTDPQSVTNLVVASLPKALRAGGGLTPGYILSLNANGTGFSISGYSLGDGKDTVLKYKSMKADVSKGSTGEAPSKKPSISETAGTSGGSSPEKQSSASDSTQPSINGLAFSFAPSSIDGTSSLQDETSIQATIDGQTVTLDEPGESSYSQVASDLYNLLLQQRLTGVSLENNEVIVTNNFSGQPVNSIQLDATDTSGNSMNWINTGVDTIYAGTSTTTVISSSTNPSLLGQPVAFTATVIGGGVTPTGTVTFTDGNTVLDTGTLDDYGNATFTTSALTLGSHDITATYGGDSNYSGSSGSLTQVVSQETGSSSVSLSSSLNPAMPNQAVTFTANVSGNGPMPTGTVTFMADNTILGSSTLDSFGNATITTSTLTLGDHTITAVYNGDALYNSSAAFLTQTIARMATNTTLSSDVNPSQPGDNVTFMAVVQPADGISGPPTGTVTFYNGTTVLGTVALDANASATLATSFGTGNYNITAIYSGDDMFAGSSGSELQTVGQPTSDPNAAVLVESSANPSLPGQQVTFTVTVNGDQSGTPTGSVTFYDGTTVLGTASLDANGNATYTTSTLPLGDHNITAIYSGDGNYAGSTGVLTQSVVQAGSTTSLTSSANPSPSGQDVTFTATVAAAVMGTGTPTGTVYFYDGTTLLGTGTLSLVNGQMQATFTTAAMGLGTHTIVAIYSGDSIFADSGASMQETID